MKFETSPSPSDKQHETDTENASEEAVIENLKNAQNLEAVAKILSEVPEEQRESVLQKAAEVVRREEEKRDKSA